MFDRVDEFVPHITVGPRLSALVPLLKEHGLHRAPSQMYNKTHFVAHETLLAFGPSGVPLFKVIVDALTSSRFREVEVDDDDAAFTRRILSSQCPEEQELLRRRIGDGG